MDGLTVLTASTYSHTWMQMDNIVFRPHTNATLAWWNPMCEELKKPWNDEESMDDACKNIVTIMNDAIAEESY